MRTGPSMATVRMEELMEQREHPAGPEQSEHGFDEGLDHEPDTAGERAEGRFGAGQERDADSRDKEADDRFSRGQEDAPEDDRERRFSEGQEAGSGDA